MSSPTFPSAIDRVLRRRLVDVHTAMPGQVESFDAAKQTANVKLLLKARRETESGSVVEEALPLAVNVPVVFQGGKGFRTVFPLEPGDGVLVVFAEASIDRWQSLGGLQETGDDRRFHLADAICIPGLHASSAPWAGLPADAMSVGSDTGPGIIFRTTSVELGARDSTPATEAVILGTSYRSAEDLSLDALVAQLTTTAAALGTAAASLTAAATVNAIPIIGGILAAAPFGVVVSQLAAIAASLSSMIASLQAFKASAASTLSASVKTR